MSVTDSRLDALLGRLIETAPAVAHAVVVSADGMPIAVSPRLRQDSADQLAAIASGLVSLTRGASQCFSGGNVNQTVVEMASGFMMVMPIDGHASLAVLAALECDIGEVGYAMAVLTRDAGQVLPSLDGAGAAGVR